LVAAVSVGALIATASVLLTNLLGSSNTVEIHLRLVSVLSSLGLLPAFWWFFGKLRLDNVAVVASMTFVALSPFLVFYAQEARPYSLLLLWEVLFLALVLPDRESLSFHEMLMASILILLVGVTQFSGLLLVASIVAYKLVSGWNNKHRRLSWILLAGLAIFVSLLPVYLAWLHRGAPLPSRAIGIQQFLYGFFTFFAGFSLGPSTHELHLGGSFSALKNDAVPLFLVLAVASFVFFRGVIRVVREKHHVLIIIPTLCLVGLVGFALIARLPLNPRHMIQLFPFFALFVGLGIASVKSVLRKILLMVVTIGILAISVFNYYYNPRYSKEDHRAAARFIQSEAREDERIFVSVIQPFQIYYHGRAKVLPFNRDDGEFIRSMREQRSEGTWVVVSRPWEFDALGEKSAYLSARGIEYQFPHVRVFHVSGNND
jgi:uncharacterized membrane protein